MPSSEPLAAHNHSCKPLIQGRRPAMQDRHRRLHRHSAAAASNNYRSSSSHIKAQLLQACSRCNNPKPGDNLLTLEQRVEELAEELSATNPTPDAALSPLLLGSWALLFSGRSRRLASAAAFPTSAAGLSLQQALQSASDSLYSLFYAYVPVLAGSAVGAGRRSSASNLQVLTADNRVDNIVTTTRGLQLRLCVSGGVEAVRGGPVCSCVAVRFDIFTVKVGQLPEVTISLALLKPLGYVDTLFLDSDLRISVGDKGGLFVLRRVD